MQSFCRLVVGDIHLRSTDDAIPRKILTAAYDVHVHSQSRQGAVQFPGLLQIAVSLGLRLDLKSVLVVKGKQDCRFRPDKSLPSLPKGFRRFAQVSEFIKPAAWHIAVVEQSVPVHLGPDICCAPTKMQHSIRAVGECLQCITPDQAGLRHPSHGRPASQATAELLHHPEGPPFDSPHHIQLERVGKARLVLCRMGRRVIVIGYKIQPLEFPV